MLKFAADVMGKKLSTLGARNVGTPCLRVLGRPRPVHRDEGVEYRDTAQRVCLFHAWYL